MERIIDKENRQRSRVLDGLACQFYIIENESESEREEKIREIQ